MKMDNEIEKSKKTRGLISKKIKER